MKKFLVALCLLITTPALAQWQVPVNSVPLGKGPGFTGFKSATGSGGTGAKCLLDTVPPSFGVCGSTIPVNVTAPPYNAKCDWNGTSGTDDHIAIQSALNSSRSILIPSACYIGTSTLTYGNLAYATLTGINSEASVLVSGSTTAPMINVVATIPGLKISHLGLSRSVTAAAGATGINFLGYVDLPILEDIEIQKQYIGLSLSSTGYGRLLNSYIHNNTSDGVVMQSPTIAGQYQWYLDTVLSSANGGRGYAVIAPANGTGFSCVSSCQVTMGTWTNTFAFSNTGNGASFLGNSNVSVQGIRILGGFWGTDGGIEGYFDTYNTAVGPHQINNLFAEINVAGPCLQFTANNGGQIAVGGTTIIGCNTYGITNAANLSLTGSSFSSNGSGNISNSGTYVGRSNYPTTVNTLIPVTEGGTGSAITSTTVGALPSCVAGLAGLRLLVTDNNTAFSFGAVITSGGTLKTPVYCDGSGTWHQG